MKNELVKVPLRSFWTREMGSRWFFRASWSSLTVWREWIPRRTGRLVYIATQTLIAQGHLSNIFPRLDIRPSANTLSMDVHLPFVEDAIFWLIGVAAAPDEERYKVKQTPYSMKSLPSLSLAVAMAHYLLSKTRVGCRAST
ncbi:hypothetical protein Moror_5911 [Moniliophthora roreri MCA 2997]|uniref:Uncharacterized protein n=1 Tax=Moniliophthora roreri (strain MCA 2997) TaxID=1381753 RepID=V2WUY9_MONRO|nr:hypothetical protein Moror_5911 [Moniliophthora roreri MCA 2997]